MVYLSSIDLLRFSSSTRALEPAKEPSGKATCRENLCASVCFVSRRCWRGDIFSKSHCQCLDSGTNSDVCKTLQDSIASALVGVALRFVAFVLVKALVR